MIAQLFAQHVRHTIILGFALLVLSPVLVCFSSRTPPSSSTMYLCNSGACRNHASFPVDSRTMPITFKSSGSVERNISKFTKFKYQIISGRDKIGCIGDVGYPRGEACSLTRQKGLEYHLLPRSTLNLLFWFGFFEGGT